MKLSIALLGCIAMNSLSFAFANPVALPEEGSTLARRDCGFPNGNCYDNGCEGQYSSDGITCTAGPYAGCPCGYGCGSSTGQCDANGCNGVGGRCTNAFRGCSCYGETLNPGSRH